MVALADNHLVAASAPIRWRARGAGDPPVRRLERNRVRARRAAARQDLHGLELRAGGEARGAGEGRGQTTPSEIAGYLEVVPDVAFPAFGTPARDQAVETLFAARSDDALLAEYEPLYRKAREVVGKSRTPYLAAATLETWLRSQGGFVYEERPEQPAGATPPLVDFVLRTTGGLLPALRRRDGGDAAAARDPGACRGRLHERGVRRPPEPVGGHGPQCARLGRGLLPRATAGCRSIRRPAAGTWAEPTRRPHGTSPSAGRPRSGSPRTRSTRSFASGLRADAGPKAPAAPRPARWRVRTSGGGIGIAGLVFILIGGLLVAAVRRQGAAPEAALRVEGPAQGGLGLPA